MPVPFLPCGCNLRKATIDKSFMSLTDLYKEGVDPLGWCETLDQVQAWKDEGRPGPYPPPHMQPGRTAGSSVAPADYTPGTLQNVEANLGGLVQYWQDPGQSMSSGFFATDRAVDDCDFDAFLAGLDEDVEMVSFPGNDAMLSYELDKSISAADDTLAQARVPQSTAKDADANETTEPSGANYGTGGPPTESAPCYDSTPLWHKGDYFRDRPGGVFTLGQKQLIGAYAHSTPAQVLQMLQEHTEGPMVTIAQVKNAMHDARRKEARREETSAWTAEELRVLRETVIRLPEMRSSVLLDVLKACFVEFEKNVEQVRNMRDAVLQQKRNEEKKNMRERSRQLEHRQE